MNKNIGSNILCISNQIRRKTSNLESIQKLNEISGTNGYILKFIAHSSTPIYQKDIEKKFSVTRSTTSKVLSLMEKKDLIMRIKDNSDSRLKRIVLTDKAQKLIREVESDISLLETQILKNLTKKEIDTLLLTLSKIECNLKEE